MNHWMIFLLITSVSILGVFPQVFIEAAAQQSITVNQTEACFLNYTAGVDMWENCGYGEDYIASALLPWEWITGGNFSMVLASILILFTYIKYHKAMYPIMIGVAMLPLTFFVFPDEFLSWAVIMAFVTVGIAVWYVYIHQTKDYGF